ncbi:MAG: HDOD domain-containing protein [Rubrivivax sp.]|jgi:EAL and modified HD-GYP domain-containing signal transduction protein|nr:HDOD domain-containing protein [Rubrivivax sp.]
MQDRPVLGQLAIGYCPMIDRQRAVVATRITILPDRPDSTPDAPALLAELARVFPHDGSQVAITLRPLDSAGGRAAPPAAGAATRVSLNIASEAWLRAMFASAPPPNLMLEVPAFMALDASNLEALQALHGEGSTLMLGGRPLSTLPRELLPCFAHSIVDVAEDRRNDTVPAHVTRTISTVQAGVRTMVELEAAFKRGSVAVLGWPLDDAPPPAKGRATVPPDLQVIMELINGVDRELPVDRLEALLKRDPTVAFRLMRYINSPAFGLTVEITSFGHAVMMLGYQRLKRWLALLLAQASKDANMKPVMYSAVRRGLLMEELVRSSGDAEMRGEMFICGVFSLLDRMLKQPFDDLLKALPVPERVQHALLGRGGPFAPYLELVDAVERASVWDIRERAEPLLLGLADVNRATLAALAAARQLEA